VRAYVRTDVNTDYLDCPSIGNSRHEIKSSEPLEVLARRRSYPA
jgi:hypothetical protein